MGNYLSSLFSHKRDYRLLMIGLDAAGKTSILSKLHINEAGCTIPTIGFNVETIKYKSLEFVIWDVGGQDRIRPLWRHYYGGSHAVIFVVDSTDRRRMEEAQKTIHQVLGDDQLKDAVLLVFANKQDQSQAMDPSEMCQALRLHELRLPWFLQPSIALTGDGLYEGLDWLSRELSGKKIRPTAPSKFSQSTAQAAYS